jgi:cell division septum initiation protein DivIVA
MGKSASDVRQDIDTTRREMGYTIDEIADRASPRRVVDRRRQRVAERWHSVRIAVMGEPDDGLPDGGPSGGALGGMREAAGSAQGTMQSAGEQASHLAGQAREAPDMVKRQAQGNPVAAGVIAFGAGLLAASLLPATEQEQQAARKLKEQTEPLQDELKQAGRQVADDLKSSAQESAEQVKQTSSDAAREVTDHARSSAQSVQDEARGGGSGPR